MKSNTNQLNNDLSNTKQSNTHQLDADHVEKKNKSIYNLERPIFYMALLIISLAINLSYMFIGINIVRSSPSGWQSDWLMEMQMYMFIFITYIALAIINIVVNIILVCLFEKKRKNKEDKFKFLKIIYFPILISLLMIMPFILLS
ncbi:MAG TPA: hypothetical protein PLD95_03840 [bacterium]|jgi:hypothetical protein|nr:hypothetical protein [bacterium]HOG38574.1 hypothetical protein [bacterium]HQI03424.1 hypothetical protein [bacterium]